MEHHSSLNLTPILKTVLYIFIPIGLLSCSSTEKSASSESEEVAVEQVQNSQQELSELEELYWDRLQNSRMSFTRADIDFMTDMITHHSQALIMSRLAPENGASYAVQTLASRIHNAQQDEIASMQKWLRDRGQSVPEVHIDGLILMVQMTEPDDSHPTDHDAMEHDGHQMNDMEKEDSDRDTHNNHDMMGQAAMSHHQHHDMPGMLTQDQLEELAAARGDVFDRKFLTFMIEHHEGAVYMVEHLFDADGAGNDNEIYDLASDIHTEQITEINRMRQMLNNLAD